MNVIQLEQFPLVLLVLVHTAVVVVVVAAVLLLLLLIGAAAVVAAAASLQLNIAAKVVRCWSTWGSPAQMTSKQATQHLVLHGMRTYQ